MFHHRPTHDQPPTTSHARAMREPKNTQNTPNLPLKHLTQYLTNALISGFIALKVLHPPTIYAIIITKIGKKRTQKYK